MQEAPVVHVRTYFLVLIALLILASLTTWVASIDLGVYNTIVALLIATTKAVLVALFFMHLIYRPGLTRIVAFAAVFWLTIMITFVMADVLSRNWTTQGAPWNLIR